MRCSKNDIIQWLGAIVIILAHFLNALGPSMYPWNILMFTVGTVLFFWWASRVRNIPQVVVNAVALFVCLFGLYNTSQVTL